MEGYRDRIAALSLELEAATATCTDNLEKLEEFVVLLEDARESERVLRGELMLKEEEVFALRVKVGVSHMQGAYRGGRVGEFSPSDADGAVVERTSAGVQRGGAVEKEVTELKRVRDSFKEVSESHVEGYVQEVEELKNMVDGLSAQLEEKCEEYTGVLEKLEELVGLLEAARAGERAALQSLDDAERELGAQQAQRDVEMGATQHIIDQLRSEVNALKRQLSESVGNMAQEPFLRDCTEALSPRTESLGCESNVRNAVTAAHANTSHTAQGIELSMREQLEQLKREKEALLEELLLKDTSYNDALAALNQHVGQLMEELSVHLRGGEESAMNARALLREIDDLRVAHGRAVALNDGANSDSHHPSE
ncbi:hypothetical protein ABL78_8042 [Leptomonas seymouri]|uniref:Uncharacterized protein n=1 Tax=Leptomonas seymouri TaxID=5684 RepID=A0A0N1IGH1_LEPSE|nr:hypothetical protein ABL78_8042 [Leptomonas seymouri]|eukprot:KPI82940.1 hypothetical protein ABL78_8042 [Leptomonas seymouri]